MASQSGDGGLSQLPSVERVRIALGDAYPHDVLVGVARRAVDLARERIRSGEPAPGFEEVVGHARRLVEEHERSLLVPVINATGVLLHTNLGRAPLGARQLDAVARVAGGYSNLEYDLASGSRGSRYDHARSLLQALTGAESGLVVNNNAAAVLVALTSLCSGREVIISRGELVEIGGGFRVPDILEASGARLVEVGTTNRTRLEDYEAAISPDTAAILKVHPSNYKMVGFTASVAGRDLARLARGRKLLFIHDIGSGLIEEFSDASDTSEPTVRVALEDGADVVTFSGDKLLGGPQAGVIVGRREPVERIARHPMMRALRVDKMTLAALEETLQIHLDGSTQQLPLHHMASLSSEEVESRARSLLHRLPENTELKAEVVAHSAVTGGGSMPGSELASWAVAISHATRGADEIARSLRFGKPPVIVRIEGDRVLVDPRTVRADQMEVLVRRIEQSL